MSTGEWKRSSYAAACKGSHKATLIHQKCFFISYIPYYIYKKRLPRLSPFRFHDETVPATVSQSDRLMACQQALKLISNPLTEWVSAPTEMKSTPHSA